MNNQRQKDQELAAFTDALLSEEVSLKDKPRPPMAGTVELLASTLTPQDPPPGLQQRMRRRIANEWIKTYPSQKNRASLLDLLGSSRRRWVWATLAALIVLALFVAILSPASEEIVGTLTGQPGVMLVIILVTVIILTMIWIVIKRK